MVRVIHPELKFGRSQAQGDQHVFAQAGGRAFHLADEHPVGRDADQELGGRRSVPSTGCTRQEETIER